jgi:hypothetical protein
MQALHILALRGLSRFEETKEPAGVNLRARNAVVWLLALSLLQEP